MAARVAGRPERPATLGSSPPSPVQTFGGTGRTATGCAGSWCGWRSRDTGGAVTTTSGIVTPAPLSYIEDGLVAFVGQHVAGVGRVEAARVVETIAPSDSHPLEVRADVTLVSRPA